MKNGEFVYGENRIAHELGVPRKELAEIRARMTKGVDWSMVGRFVAYSSSGVQRLLDDSMWVKERKDGQPPEVTKIEAISVLDIKCLLRSSRIDQSLKENLEKEWKAKVVRIFPKNPRFMFAELTGPVKKGRSDHEKLRVEELTGAQVRVRVANNSKFTRNMEMTVRHINNDLFELVGRLPRFRGKW